MVCPFLAALFCLSVYRTVALVSRYVLYGEKYCIVEAIIDTLYMLCFRAKSIYYLFSSVLNKIKDSDWLCLVRILPYGLFPLKGQKLYISCFRISHNKLYSTTCNLACLNHTWDYWHSVFLYRLCCRCSVCTIGTIEREIFYTPHPGGSTGNYVAV